MATADQMRALAKSHSEGDGDRFYSVAMQVAANEATKECLLRNRKEFKTDDLLRSVQERRNFLRRGK